MSTDNDQKYGGTPCFFSLPGDPGGECLSIGYAILAEPHNIFVKQRSAL